MILGLIALISGDKDNQIGSRDPEYLKLVISLLKIQQINEKRNQSKNNAFVGDDNLRERKIRELGMDQEEAEIRRNLNESSLQATNSGKRKQNAAAMLNEDLSDDEEYEDSSEEDIDDDDSNSTVYNDSSSLVKVVSLSKSLLCGWTLWNRFMLMTP